MSHYRGRYYSTKIGTEMFLRVAEEHYGEQFNDVVKQYDIDTLIDNETQ